MMMINWSLETKKIKDLKPYEKNPRYITEESATHLKKSLDRFGMIDKPIINADMRIIGGHQRISLLKGDKIKTVECWIPDRLLNEEEVEELNIRLNKNQGAFDYDILANQFETLDLLNYGFSEEDLLGSSLNIEEVKEEKAKGGKKLKMCPSCGHEF